MTPPRLLFVHALSPLHAGTGQSIGAIDLAIARDRATQFPYLPGSSLKGSLRDVAEQSGIKDSVKILFGPTLRKDESPSDHAGALVVSDANLLLLPVRSVVGTFAWVTSPYLLHRFRRDVEAAGLSGVLKIPPDKDLPKDLAGCSVGTGRALIAQVSDFKSTKNEDKVLFEDLDFVPQQHASIDAFASELGKLLFPDDPFWQQSLAKRLCVVHDDVMTFLSEHATDVVARIALEQDKKTVAGGALWYEESLPTESILVSLLHAQTIRAQRLDATQCLAQVQSLVRERPSIQLGGKATIGRGRCRLVLPEAQP